MHKHRRFWFICMIATSIAVPLEASPPHIAFEGSEIPLSSLILLLGFGEEYPGTQQRAAAAIKEKKVSGDQILLAWAKLGRLLSRGEIIDYDTEHWLRVRDAVFRLSALDNTSASLQNTLKSDESVLALDVLALNSAIIQLGDENPQVQQQATTAIKEMKMSDDQLLLTWANVTRLFHIGGLFHYNVGPHWQRVREAVFRLVNIDKTSLDLLDTLFDTLKTGNKDEFILARFVIEEIGELLHDSSIKLLPGTVPLLTESLKDPDAEIREIASHLLEVIPSHADPLQEKK